ncbi:MAG: hypothetical protein JST54_14830 [Deltaproteobacteria bacterium]|nr:hypothetical protein [Deltaproteobacteria bacterium]
MSDFPFLYLDHGRPNPDLVDKVGMVALAFAQPVSVPDRLKLQATVPDAFAGFFKWSDVLFTSESMSDVFSAVVYGDADEGDEQALDAFANEVETWIRGVHAKHPLLFFVGPTPALPGSAWADWSQSRASEVVLPFLEKYADTHPEALLADDDDNDTSEPMANFGRVDLAQMQVLLRSIDSERLAGSGAEGKARVKKLLARFAMKD